MWLNFIICLEFYSSAKVDKVTETSHMTTPQNQAAYQKEKKGVQKIKKICFYKDIGKIPGAVVKKEKLTQAVSFFKKITEKVIWTVKSLA